MRSLWTFDSSEQCVNVDPYTSGAGATGVCKTTCKPAVTLTGFTDVPSEAGMIAAITKGPVSVAIEADKSAFQLYKGVVLDNPACGKKLDHGASCCCLVFERPYGSLLSSRGPRCRLWHGHGQGLL